MLIRVRKEVRRWVSIRGDLCILGESRSGWIEASPRRIRHKEYRDTPTRIDMHIDMNIDGHIFMLACTHLPLFHAHAGLVTVDRIYTP